MIRKYIIILLFLLFLSGCDEPYSLESQYLDVIKNRDTLLKIYFIYNQVHTYDFKELKNDRGFQIYFEKNPSGFLKSDDCNTTFTESLNIIDPFIPGAETRTIRWSFPPMFGGQASRISKYSGSPVKYIFDREKKILYLIFSGPDKDIDTPDIPGQLFKDHIETDFNRNGPERHMIPFYRLKNTIEYDPTNGTFSNGDIIWCRDINNESQKIKVKGRMYFFTSMY